jgi:hypothetical protein
MGVPTMLQDASTIQATNVIYELTRAEGNLNLAAERLHITPGQVVAVIASNPITSNSLYDQSRVSILLSMMDLLNQVKIALTNSLSDIAPYDLSKTYTSLIQSITTLSKLSIETAGTGAAANNGPVQGNAAAELLRFVPPDIRRILEAVNPTEDNADSIAK